jgi:hypothetical protein
MGFEPTTSSLGKEAGRVLSRNGNGLATEQSAACTPACNEAANYADLARIVAVWPTLPADSPGNGCPYSVGWIEALPTMREGLELQVARSS